MSINLDILREFVAFTQNLSVSKTAEELYISQPALSRHISQLESELHCQLFSREDGFELLPGGYVVLDAAQKMLDIEKQMNRSLSELKESITGIVRVQELYHYAPYMELYTSTICELSRRFPGIRVVQKPMPRQFDPLQSLQRQFHDAVIVFRFGELDQTFEFPSGIAAKRVEPLVKRMSIIVGESHPLAEFDELSLRDFKDEYFIVNNRKEYDDWREAWKELCGRYGFDPHYDNRPYASSWEYYYNDLGDSVLSIMSSASGPVPYISEHINAKQIHLKEDIYLIPHLAYLEDSSSEAARAFIDLLLGETNLP